MLDSKDEPPVTEILNWVWQLWVSGRIPDTIGEHLFCLAPRSQNATWIGVGAVTVTGWMASSPGVVKHGLLRDAHIAATFDEIKGPLTLEPVNSETALADIIKKQRNSLVMRVRVPRIVSAVGYWPPTVEAMNKAKALVDAGKPVRFEDMEGTNIMDAWRFKTG
ncbi:hypothetical protein GGD63_006531 [Bradyrhizobium sp. cir1]|uniref:hypothetical protein n=1 Tax=Bradyrhizobium sp. cir1 TaxID=1445730 RepID=UPI001606ADD7|nr:hypothetical protein [Bradyrhizobium sp. cir1]MBB4373703.1 hypothetical protein [Bradyrhizobium sp. cir1]